MQMIDWLTNVVYILLYLIELYCFDLQRKSEKCSTKKIVAPTPHIS